MAEGEKAQASQVRLYAVIRIRGRVDVHPDVEHTLALLRLHRKFHLVLYPSTLPGIWGMLHKVKDWATWGEIDRETLIELLRRRGRVPGNKPLTDDYVREKLGLKGGIEELADKLLRAEIVLHRLYDKRRKIWLIKPVFRLHPPRGGFRGSIKKPYGAGGELGYRGPAINELIRRML
ncbi:50S ribosomal protein L30 [Pyrodictium occultum]|uniref:Large ribosomal subunit protein uL30 n=1 Tax=Pyrodictium occultum TaxID=2309 RepID=A0A0V8RXF6_PYROC|nr:50S ribosomal protein L30 [Pyrodictium occultum]KSW12761.1 50S ribosomal protein L30 [Pyrodictium occultum]